MTNRNNHTFSHHLRTGLIALAFALVACIYLFRPETDFSMLETGYTIEATITEPIPPFIPGMWQISY